MTAFVEESDLLRQSGSKIATADSSRYTGCRNVIGDSVDICQAEPSDGKVDEVQGISIDCRLEACSITFLSKVLDLRDEATKHDVDPF